MKTRPRPKTVILPIKINQSINLYSKLYKLSSSTDRKLDMGHLQWLEATGLASMLHTTPLA